MLTFASVLTSSTNMVIAKAEVVDPGYMAVCVNSGSSSGNDSSGESSSGTATKSSQKYKPTDFPMPDFGDEKIQEGHPDYSLCKKIADAVGKAVGCDPKFVFAQIGEESGWGGAQGALIARDGEHNLSGIGYVAGTPGVKGGSEHAEGDGAYGSYDSWQHYAMAYASILANMLDGNDQAKHDPKAFIHVLKQHNYFSDNEAHYLAGFMNMMSKYDNAGNSQAGSAGAGNAAASDGANSSGNNNPACDNVGNADGSGQVSGDIVKNARALMGWFHYSQGNRTNFMSGGKKPDDLKSQSDLNKDGNADCSSFVWLVLKESGYSVPPNVGWYTKTMADDAKGAHKWFKQIDPKDAKPGDVIIVNEGSGEGDNGHTAIISSNWQGYDNTKCINEGGDDQTVFHNDGVCEDTIRKQFWTMLDQGEVVIAEPVKANNSKK